MTVRDIPVGLAALLRESDRLLSAGELCRDRWEQEWVEDLMAAYDRTLDRTRREEANRIWKALMLAPTIDVCRALLAGESVPLERLDPAAATRLGRRRPR